MMIDIRHMSKEVARMTKAEIVAKVAEEIKVSKTAAGKTGRASLARLSPFGSIRQGPGMRCMGFSTHLPLI